MMCRAGGNYGEPFNAESNVTQGGPLSSLMFNVCADALVMEWLCQTLDKDAAQDGVGDRVVDFPVAFYVDDGLIASPNPVWLQEPFDILSGLFKWISLFTNASKTKVMVCIYTHGLHGGRVRLQISNWSSCRQQALSSRL